MKALVDGVVKVIADSLQTYPIGMGAKSLQVTDTGIDMTLDGGRFTLPATMGESNCGAQLIPSSTARVDDRPSRVAPGDHRKRCVRRADPAARLHPEPSADGVSHQRNRRTHSTGRVEAGAGLDEVRPRHLRGPAGRDDRVIVQDRGFDDDLEDDVVVERGAYSRDVGLDAPKSPATAAPMSITMSISAAPRPAQAVPQPP